MDALSQKSEIRLADKLWKFHWDCGRQGDLCGVFIATEEEVQSLVRRLLEAICCTATETK